MAERPPRQFARPCNLLRPAGFTLDRPSGLLACGDRARHLPPPLSMLSRLLSRVALLLALLTPAIAVAAPKPNIVFLIADDMGYGDLGCYGAPDCRTPALDALATSGARFTDAYAAFPVCSP